MKFRALIGFRVRRSVDPVITAIVWMELLVTILIFFYSRDTGFVLSKAGISIRPMQHLGALA